MSGSAPPEQICRSSPEDPTHKQCLERKFPFRSWIQKAELRGITLEQLLRVYDFAYSDCPLWHKTSTRNGGSTLSIDTINLLDINDWIVRPATAELECAFVELLSSGEQRPEWFISHSWKESLRTFLGCLHEHVLLRKAASSETWDVSAADRLAVYWVKAFAIRQGDDDDDASFGRALGLCMGVLLIVGGERSPSSRMWCQYEETAAVCASSSRRSRLLLDVVAPQTDLDFETKVDRRLKQLCLNSACTSHRPREGEGRRTVLLHGAIVEDPAVVGALPRDLESMRISLAGVTQAGSSGIVQALRERTMLKELRIDLIGCTCMHTEFPMNLCLAMASLRELETVCMAADWPLMPINIVEHLLFRVKSSEKLHTFRCRGGGSPDAPRAFMTDESFRALIEALEGKKLKELSLSLDHVGVQDYSIRGLADLLSGMEHLKSLYLSLTSSLLADGGMKCLGRAIAGLRSLEMLEVDVVDSVVSDGGARCFSEAVANVPSVVFRWRTATLSCTDIFARKGRKQGQLPRRRAVVRVDEIPPIEGVEAAWTQCARLWPARGDVNHVSGTLLWSTGNFTPCRARAVLYRAGVVAVFVDISGAPRRGQTRCDFALTAIAGTPIVKGDVIAIECLRAPADPAFHIAAVEVRLMYNAVVGACLCEESAYSGSPHGAMTLCASCGGSPANRLQPENRARTPPARSAFLADRPCEETSCVEGSVEGSLTPRESDVALQEQRGRSTSIVLEERVLEERATLQDLGGRASSDVLEERSDRGGDLSQEPGPDAGEGGEPPLNSPGPFPRTPSSVRVGVGGYSWVLTPGKRTLESAPRRTPSIREAFGEDGDGELAEGGLEDSMHKGASIRGKSSSEGYSWVLTPGRRTLESALRRTPSIREAFGEDGDGELAEGGLEDSMHKGASIRGRSSSEGCLRIGGQRSSTSINKLDLLISIDLDVLPDGAASGRSSRSARSSRSPLDSEEPRRPVMAPPGFHRRGARDALAVARTEPRLPAAVFELKGGHVAMQLPARKTEEKKPWIPTGGGARGTRPSSAGPSRGSGSRPSTVGRQRPDSAGGVKASRTRPASAGAVRSSPGPVAPGRRAGAQPEPEDRLHMVPKATQTPVLRRPHRPQRLDGSLS